MRNLPVQKTAKKSTVKKPAVQKSTIQKATIKKPVGKKKILVVVESPAKAKTIEKYLGKNFIVRASMGHLRDLPKSQFGIDVEHGFEPKYINIRGKGDLIRDLKKYADQSDRIFLASDPDREGEAIAWHLSHILGINPDTDCRIVFNEITKPAIQAAIKTPHPIDMSRVNAQQARRLLDRIVGYKLSPLLWKKIQKGLSAGRVQSVALKMICDREREIQAFNPEEYWTIDLQFKHGTLFQAELEKIDGEKLEIHDEKTAQKIVAEIEKSQFIVESVKIGTRKKKTPAPFTTSSMQQDAAHKLGFTSKRTMAVAQQLYEGLKLANETVGLITYMRTDSTRVSDLAQSEAKKFFLETFGEKYVPENFNIYASGKKAQDAHEAIRPTSILRTPESVEQFLTPEQFKLYRLIWQRFAASQMTPAIYNTVSVTITSRDKKFLAKSNGSKLEFDGFLRVYGDSKKEKDIVIPSLEIGDDLDLKKILPLQHFTEPPPRYNDASLVKLLEEKEIGRPSTYAPTIDTIINRGYVKREEKQFHPTELGFDVLDLLQQYFGEIVDVKFTANMESELDEIAEGKIETENVLREFYTPFEKQVEAASESIEDAKPQETDVICEKCGRHMIIKHGRFGNFLACPGYPECKNTKPIQKDTGHKCPKCGGSLVEKKMKKGKRRVFYGCSNYPECDYTTWNLPKRDED
ncbi:MAG: type I DNA topoisomerase [Selenomonadaceae bacterium]|nr:type I DNA topoisomerase [Selenomonadaceae bacterium]